MKGKFCEECFKKSLAARKQKKKQFSGLSVGETETVEALASLLTVRKSLLSDKCFRRESLIALNTSLLNRNIMILDSGCSKTVVGSE